MLRHVASLILVGALAACSDDPPVAPSDAAPDTLAPADTSPADTGLLDVPRDVARDTASPDTAAPDDTAAPPDVARDVPADTAAPPDVATDAPRDTAADLPRDTPTDAPRDVAPDTVAPPWGLDSRPPNPTCRAFARPTGAAGIRLVPVWPSLTPRPIQPIALVQAPNDSTRFFAVERGGRVLVIPSLTATTTTPFVTLYDRVDSSSLEGGLLGMAFHPRFATNGQVFLSYTAGPSGAAVLRSRVSRFASRDGGRTLDPASEQVLLEIPQPFANHNGGGIAFGPDGYLYLGMGDGGSGGDPMGNGQNVNVLLGKFLRVDVDRGAPYAIPPDNPFARGGGRPEIFAWGLRNPWRWSFDRATGDLWAGDVGQTAREEVDLIRRGGNYGWNVREGFLCYGRPTCPTAGFVDPVVDYGRAEGTSITGGYVYRGRAIPGLVGTYVFGDFGSGRIWGVTFDAAGRAGRRLLVESGLSVASFAEGNDGELYVVDIGARFQRIEPSGAPPMDTVPPTLSATGCVDPRDATRPAAGMIPYDLNAPFWSDGLDKQRWLALPDGARIHVNADGDWDLPVGTVLMKTFTHAGRRVETRLFVRHADGEWAGYSYAWNSAGTDATLLPGGSSATLAPGLVWSFPSRAQCLQCHTTAAGRSLGLETAQLDRAFRYPNGRVANQLATLAHIDLFDAPLPSPAPPTLPLSTDPAPTVTRARAWLHANCSFCHRPGATGGGAMDLRYATAFAATGTCGVAPRDGDLGVAGARVIAPGDPSRSLLSVRLRRRDAAGMPPLASTLVDPTGAAVVDGWITSLRSCP